MDEKKKRLAVWLSPDVLQRADTWLATDNCKTRSEFIEKAMRFYMGYLAGVDTSDYLAKTLVDTIKATIHDSENRICTLLYKLTVEVDIMAHIIARHFGGDHFSLRDLRRYAVDEVNKTNGQIKFSDALETQRQMLLEEETEW